MATATPAKLKTHTFISRGANERLVRRPLRRSYVDGMQITTQEPVRYEFEARGRIGYLTVYEGQDRLPDGPIDPETLQPSVQDAVQWLRAHPLFNVRFHEDGNEPDRPRPTEDEYLEALSEASATLNLDAATDLLQQERETHQRPLLIRTTERAIEQIQRGLAEADENRAKIEAEMAKAKKG